MSAPAPTLAAAVAAAQARGTELGRGMTTQARMCVAAMRHIGIPRKDFRVRTTMPKRGLYGAAVGSALTRGGWALIREHADELAAAGLRVTILDNEIAVVSCGGGDSPGVCHIGTDGQDEGEA